MDEINVATWVKIEGMQTSCHTYNLRQQFLSNIRLCNDHLELIDPILLPEQSHDMHIEEHSAPTNVQKNPYEVHRFLFHLF